MPQLSKAVQLFFHLFIEKFLKESKHNDILFEILLRKEVVSNIEKVKYRINDFEHSVGSERLQRLFTEFANEISVVEMKAIFGNGKSGFVKQYKKLRKDYQNEILDLITQIIENVDRIKKDSENTDYMADFCGKKPSERAKNLRIKLEKLKEFL